MCRHVKMGCGQNLPCAVITKSCASTKPRCVGAIRWVLTMIPSTDTQAVDADAVRVGDAAFRRVVTAWSTSKTLLTCETVLGGTVATTTCTRLVDGGAEASCSDCGDTLCVGVTWMSETPWSSSNNINIDGFVDSLTWLVAGIKLCLMFQY